MARISVFQQGVGREAPQVTPFRAPDFGPGIGGAVERAGQALGETAQKVDEIQDFNARIEANRLTIAHNNLMQAISQRVRTTLGEGAEAAADKGISDLESESAKLLSEASPRAKRMLEPVFAERNGNAKGEWTTYGFEQKKQAFDTSSQAANDKDLDTALHQDTDQAAKPYLDSIAQRNHQRASFFGLGSDWETQENLKAVSGYHKGRALMIGVNSATDAVNYAVRNRNSMSEDDFAAIVRTYRDEALDERAQVEAMGYGDSGSSGVTDATNEDGTPGKRADPSLVFKGLILRNEGTTLVQHDSNGAPVKYGINQKENPDVDVSKLTAAGAEKLFTDRYWKASGADKLPPALAVMHADTAYVAGVKKANQILRESGHDASKYMELRDNFLAGLHASNPQKYPDYTSRNERVEKFAAMQGGDGKPFTFTGNITPSTSMGDVEKEVMARTDIPMALKTRIIQRVRAQRETLRQDKSIREDDARDSLITAVTKLGDNFTSLKQLPQDQLSNASPEVVASLTKMARSNTYKRNDDKLLPEITYDEFTNPQRFMSKDYLVELGRRGASPALVAKVASKQAEFAQKQLSAKPSVLSDKTLWNVAEPAFKAAGIITSTTGKHTQAAAQQQMQAVNFLQRLATTWEQENPGKRATPEIMRQWVATALLDAHGKRLYQASDQDIYNSLSDAIRGTLVRGLRRHGDHAQGPELVAHVASAYRQLRALYGTGPIAFRPDDSVGSSPLQGVEVGTGMPQQSDMTGIDMSDVDYENMPDQ